MNSNLELKKELVWAIPRYIWENFCNFEGYQRDFDGKIYNLLIQYGEFRYRHEIENDLNYKQIIPQGLIRFQDYVFVNERLAKQSEQRLNYLYSLGVGGHLNIHDNLLEHMDLIQLGLHREMTEEVSIPRPFSVKYIGITNDEKADVSKVHIGVWFEVEVINQSVQVKEKEKLEGFWKEIKDLHLISPKFESWAELIYKQYLFPTLPQKLKETINI